MGNKDWDNYLKDILGEFKSGGETPRWDDFTDQDTPESDPGKGPEQLQDEAFKETLSHYSPTVKVEGWERIESSLDEADKVFDQQVRNRVNHYQAHPDPHSWTLFLKHFTSHKLLRTKLITLKVLESAAVLLLLITALHLGQIGKLPFAPSNMEENNGLAAEAIAIAVTPDRPDEHVTGEPTINSGKIPSGLHKASGPGKVEKIDISGAGIATLHTQKHFSGTSADRVNKNSAPAPSREIPAAINGDAMAAFSTAQQDEQHTISPLASATSVETEAKEFVAEMPESSSSTQTTIITESLARRFVSLELPNVNPVPDPIFVKAIEKTYLEFGMLAQVDYNQLKMPEDRLFNEGKQIVFPLQGIASPGYGAGFTLAIGHTKWAMEAGLIYSANSFRPGRELTVGSLVDHSKVEFEAMRMQMVSLPLQYRYRFDHKGRLKVYALAGFGFHYIAQSDVDVMVEHNFNSLTAGEDPNNNPTLARTIRQAQRVSEDLRDAAPFSKKTYISANLGAGLEYALTDRKTIFLQTAYQYQIPKLRFSNHDGKHLRSLSFQAGVRTPLGS